MDQEFEQWKEARLRREYESEKIERDVQARRWEQARRNREYDEGTESLNKLYDILRR